MSDEIIGRAEMARQVLDNEIYQEAWADVEAACIEALIDLDKKDDDGRRRLSDAVKTLRTVKRALEATLEAGQVAAKDVAEIQKGKRSFF